MQRPTPNTMGVASPALPPWIHSTTSRTSLAGLEIGLPPSPAPSAGDMSLDCPSSRLDKALPPTPRPAPENTSRRALQNPFLDIPQTHAPDIPRKNPRRFSWVSSDVSPTAGSPLTPLRGTSSSIHSPISITSASAIAPPAVAHPPTDWRHNSSAPQPLKLKLPSPLPSQTNKVARLTGCDLSSDPSPSQVPPRFESNTSICSRYYSDRATSPTTLTSDEGRHSDDSLSSIVDSYSDWGSWAPSKEDFSSPLSSPHFPQSPTANMHFVSPEDVGSTSTITSQSNTRTPVPPPVPPPRNRTRQLGPPETVAWRTSYKKSPMQPATLEHLIEQERNHLENNFDGEPPLSPLAQIAALQLQRDSGFSNAGEERIGRSAIRPQTSMPSIPSTYHHQHTRSVSRFSTGSSSSSDDARSVRSFTSARIRHSARSVRDSFVRGLSGLNRPSSRNNRTSSRLSHVSDTKTARSSQRTSDTSATTLSPAQTNKSHKYTLSSSTTYSIPFSRRRASTASSQEPKPKARDSGFSRSWAAAASAFKKPLRSSYFTHGTRPEAGTERRRSRRHGRMVSAPAAAPGRFYGEGIRQFPKRQASQRASAGSRRAAVQLIAPPLSPPPAGVNTPPEGAIELAEAKKQNAGMLPEEIRAASRAGCERAVVENGNIDHANQTAVINGRRFSITGKAGKVLGTVDTTVLPPPLPIGEARIWGVPLVEREGGERERKEKGGRGFGVLKMVGRELDALKKRTGIRSKEEKRREQLKGLIRVVECEEKDKEQGKRPGRRPMVPQREKVDAQWGETEHVEMKEEEKANAKPGLREDERSSAAQMWL